jgi:glutathione-regulated potassium-efflux system protein KefB
MELGVEFIVRDTYLSALDLTRRTLIGLGMDERVARQTIDAFSQSDRDRLYRDYHHASDVDKLRESARQQAAELAELFQRDVDKDDGETPA